MSSGMLRALTPAPVHDASSDQPRVAAGHLHRVRICAKGTPKRRFREDHAASYNEAGAEVKQEYRGLDARKTLC